MTAFKNKTWASFFQKPAVYIEDQEDDKFAMVIQDVSPFLKIFPSPIATPGKVKSRVLLIADHFA